MWVALFVSLIFDPSTISSTSSKTEAIVNSATAVSPKESSKLVDKPIVDQTPPSVHNAVKPLPKAEGMVPLEEIERNMTLYLQALHTRLGAIAGPKVTAVKAWNEYVDVTSTMTMTWDDENKHRYRGV